MPFTFAHPAAAAPLLRPLGRFGSLSALCIGSIAPDLAFIVPLDLAREQTHGWLALLLFCLPAGGLTYLLFHALLREPLIALLPERIASSIGDRAREPWRAVLVSLLCGAMTHVLWDAFTHPGTAVVNALPVLQSELANLGGYRVYAFSALQHGSSVLGLLLLGWWSMLWLRRAPALHRPRANALSTVQRAGVWVVLAGLPCLAGMWAGWRRSPVIADMVDLQAFAAGFIFTALPVAAFALTAFSVLWQWRRNCL